MACKHIFTLLGLVNGVGYGLEFWTVILFFTCSFTFYWVGLITVICTLPICFSKKVRNKDDHDVVTNVNCGVALILNWSISISNHETCKIRELKGPWRMYIASFQSWTLWRCMQLIWAPLSPKGKPLGWLTTFGSHGYPHCNWGGGPKVVGCGGTLVLKRSLIWVLSWSLQ